jgi:hypothetical protein
MQGGKTPHEFVQIALGIFDYIRELNQPQNPAVGPIFPPNYAQRNRPAKSPKSRQEFLYRVSSVLT